MSGHIRATEPDFEYKAFPGISVALAEAAQANLEAIRSDGDAGLAEQNVFWVLGGGAAEEELPALRGSVGSSRCCRRGAGGRAAKAGGLEPAACSHGGHLISRLPRGCGVAPIDAFGQPPDLSPPTSRAAWPSAFAVWSLAASGAPSLTASASLRS